MWDFKPSEEYIFLTSLPIFCRKHINMDYSKCVLSAGGFDERYFIDNGGSSESERISVSHEFQIDNHDEKR